MKWLMISSHDERYDFNLQMKIFNGSIEDFENSIHHDFSKKEREKKEDGSYVYHKENRSNKLCSNVDKEVWDKLKDHLEVISFHTLILVPFENLDDDFFLENPIVNRNVKFGFLDIIENKN
jgi:hypothetical protein